MKRVLPLLMAVIVLVSTLWVSVGSAGAAGIIAYVDGRFVWGKGVVFVFDASGYRNKDVKNASIFAGSNFHDLYCTVNKNEEKIVCVARGSLTEYAGQTGVIYLAGQIFYVTIPDRVQPEVELSLTCPDGETAGAFVKFEASGGGFDVFFIPGATMQEVKNTADEYVISSEGYFVGYEIISGLECGFIPQ